jgi:hypothetical protein
VTNINPTDAGNAPLIYGVIIAECFNDGQASSADGQKTYQ